MLAQCMRMAPQEAAQKPLRTGVRRPLVTLQQGASPRCLEGLSHLSVATRLSFSWVAG